MVGKKKREIMNDTTFIVDNAADDVNNNGDPIMLWLWKMEYKKIIDEVLILI